MIPTLVATVAIFGLAILGLSLGNILHGRQIKGHCGGQPSLPEKCVRDKFGNKIEPCAHCDCE